MSAPFYTVRATQRGVWVVVHPVPGTNVDAVDVECPSMQAAEREAAWMNYDREQQQQALRRVQRLCGVRG
jgi:hypothetical protein